MPWNSIERHLLFNQWIVFLCLRLLSWYAYNWALLLGGNVQPSHVQSSCDTIITWSNSTRTFFILKSSKSWERYWQSLWEIFFFCTQIVWQYLRYIMYHKKRSRNVWLCNSFLWSATRPGSFQSSSQQRLYQVHPNTKLLNRWRRPF